ncbi:hypothetical protein F4802DRAFT_308782 [Xylaria palmicola]|nr:hypothetical protein F4802DRAFT_308782 [Xylaria palmicola]
MPCPQSLSNLTPREAVTDAVHRVLMGMDRHDTAMANSAFAAGGDDEDFHFELRDGATTVIRGVSTWRRDVLGRIGPMDTTHMISNARVDVEDGARTASLRSLVLAQHALPGRGNEVDSPKYLVGAEYVFDLVKDEGDGLWKIKYWLVDTIWAQGDKSIMPKYEY